MSEELALIDDALTTMFDRQFDRSARIEVGSAFPTQLWHLLDEAGMTTLGELANGVGLAELVTLARAVGRAAVPIPLIESAGIASWLVSSAGLDMPAGVLTSASAQPSDWLELTENGAGMSVSGELRRVPWGADADHVIALARYRDTTQVVIFPVAAATVSPGHNLAGEPRDSLVLKAITIDRARIAPSALTADDLLLRGAVLRSAAMTGAMETVRDLALGYAQERRQFGKPIATFQAVAQHLVAVGEETMVAAMALECAVAAPEELTELAVAAAKQSAGSGARIVARRAHQVHAAIGVTDEHSLPWFTKRLWSWEDEFGPTGYWARRLGRSAIAAGGAALWPTISTPVGRAPDEPTKAA